MAGAQANVLLECNSPANLLALAEARHGVAVISSLVRTSRYNLKVARIEHRGAVMMEPLVLVWDSRQKLPPYAERFRKMVAMQLQHYFP
jgi:DNA-binding transcriptional LysR family regulator